MQAWVSHQAAIFKETEGALHPGGSCASLPQGKALFFPELHEQAQGAPGREPKQGEKLAGFQRRATKMTKMSGNGSSGDT